MVNMKYSKPKMKDVEKDITYGSLWSLTLVPLPPPE